MAEVIWRLERGEGPVVAMAIHDGHAVRAEVRQYLALTEEVRLREEDPFTGQWTVVAPTRLVGLRSRFEVDLNRPRDKAVYRTPEDAWGLKVWTGKLPEDVIARSLQNYDAFYRAFAELCRSLAERYGRFLILDLHSYNHRRGGPDAPPADPATNPQVNLGTGTMIDRTRWGSLIDRFRANLGSYDFPGGKLDVRENVRFRGGTCAAWAHHFYPEAACVLSVEIKKFFMDEWTGEPHAVQVAAMTDALRNALASAADELERT